MNERFSYRLVRDLFAHKDAIFGELKRASTLTHSSSGAQRPRAISTDESNRRANMEERQRAIAAQRSPRGVSPGPGNRSSGSHRRDRSQTRFPVNTASPTEARKAGTQRGSLEVPSTLDSPVVDEASTNGTSEAAAAPAPAAVAAAPATSSTPATPVEQSAAPTRVPFPRKPAGSLARGNRDSTGSLRSVGGAHDESVRGVTLEDAPRGVTLEDTPRGVTLEDAPRGVTLEDKPMDD
jgi:hypothetical protein